MQIAYKLADTVKARILYGDDEIEASRSVRYISASEAMWHIFGFKTQEGTPSASLLFVHVPDEQPAIYDEADDLELRLSNANKAVSDLMKKFGRPVFDEFQSLTYLQYFEQCSIEVEKRKTRTRTSHNDIHPNDNDDSINIIQSQHRRDRYLNYFYPKTTHNVSHIQYMSPDYGEVWYLRLLLLRAAQHTAFTS